MDDNDVCPLCCEELDISDRQFFPCKCGYQVCMWCWHRIKESESGLCPACRTPYGDDPHEFSAVDMEDVVKANKEKAAAEKREKERLRQQQAAASGGCIVIGGGAGVAGMHIGGGSDGDLAVASSGSSRGHMEPPKDRNQLANMRVIRRNLVYAVGLPPSIATEEILRKPEHFGQYGKISKIVLNRNHNGNGDPRRASASAYVTFAHKEDALACILALDGFYVDARNIRASYGTSKYCSAFIKNVRCNNPDCTYLHMMGDSDDMFTKQEIQAGYVTSGRDVLAKQQQLIAANIGSGSRRRVGSGGPSGTGKVASNPVFPPPTYEEPSKPSQTNLVPPPPPSTSSTAQFPPVSSSVQRFASTTNGISGFSSVAAAGKASRSASVPNPTISSNAPHSNSGASISSNGSNKSEASLTPAEMLSRQQEQLRKLHPQNNNSTSSTSSTGQKTQAQTSNIDRGVPLPNNSSSNSSTTQATAASVVAGVHSTNRSGPTPPAPHTTLTALTPLKRAASVPEKNKQIISNNEVVLENNNMKLSSLRNNSTVLGNVVQTNGGMPNVTNSPSSSISSTNGPPISQTKLSSVDNGPIGAGAIGGTIIGHNISNSGSGVIGSIGPPTSMPIGSGEVNGKSIIGKSHAVGPVVGGSLPNLVGGQTFGNFGEPEKKNAIGGSDLFSSSSILSGGGDGNQWGGFSMSNSNGSDHLFGSNDNFGAIGAPGIWGNESENAKCQSQFSSNNGSHIGINPQSMQSSVQGNNNGIGMNMSGSSALASMLGIQLPTGVGTLRDSLWASSTPVRTPQTAMKNNLPAPTPIGSGIKKSNEGVIIGGGQIPIGGMNSTAIGGSNHGPGSGNTNDIKLLQSLLPGVHITSGNAYQPAAPNMHMSNKQNNNSFGGVGWGGYASTQPNGNNQVQHRQSQQHVIHGAPIGVGNLLPKDAQHQQGNDMWGGTRTQNNTAAQQQQKGSNIW